MVLVKAPLRLAEPRKTGFERSKTCLNMIISVWCLIQKNDLALSLHGVCHRGPAPRQAPEPEAGPDLSRLPLRA